MALIILVEDDEEVRLTIRMLLEDCGHKCLDFSNSDKAMDILRETPGVDLLVLDIFMPSSDGRDLVTILRNGPPRFRNMPVVLISGAVPEQTVRLYSEDRYCKFLKKPFTGGMLKTIVDSLLFPDPA